MQIFRHHQPEHAVAKEFQPFIGADGTRAGMRQRAFEQGMIGKFVPDPGFEARQINR
jgi:hypothetical protein